MRLSIPLFFLTLGIIGRIMEYFPMLFLDHPLFINIQLSLVLTIIFIGLEKSAINNKKVHFITGIFIVFGAYIVEYHTLARYLDLYLNL